MKTNLNHYLPNGFGLEDAAFLDLQIHENADGTSIDAGLVVFRHPGLEHYQRLIEAARSRLADLELDYGVEKSKVDSVRSRLFGALRPYYQERDRLRLLIQYRLDHTLMELRSLYEHLQARILELIETLDTLRASPDYEVFLFAEKDAAVIDTIAAAQQEELEKEITGLQAEAERVAEEARELVGEVPF